jgi:hypothetical protein
MPENIQLNHVNIKQMVHRPVVSLVVFAGIPYPTEKYLPSGRISEACDWEPH